MVNTWKREGKSNIIAFFKNLLEFNQIDGCLLYQKFFVFCFLDLYFSYGGTKLNSKPLVL